MMGFFKTCLDFITHAAVTPFASFGNLFSSTSQQPLFASIERYSAADFPNIYKPSIIPSRDCKYPGLERSGYRICQNEAKSCWLTGPDGDYTVETDNEADEGTPTGTYREYWITIDKAPHLSPDGQTKIGGVTLNGTYPGPVIEACWGDEIIVHVKNLYLDNGTTIHWHGLRMYKANAMDGVNGVTQCPIAQNDEFTYAFHTQQHGHTWYHSHYSLQYPDGVAGPLLIHGPTSAEWDNDLGPVMISDWIHDTAFAAFNCEAYPDLPECQNGESPPRADNIVVNGIGAFKQKDGTYTNNYFKTMFTPKKKHLLRLINGSASSNFIFSIDNHTLEVIANDLVPIEPYQTNSIMLGIGQRYTVVVEADQPAELYWIRTTPADECNTFRKNKTTGEFTQIKETTAFIVYEGAPKSDRIPHSEKQPGITNSCKDESEYSQDRLVPKVPWTVPDKPSNNVTKASFSAGYEKDANPYLYPEDPFKHWVFGNNENSDPVWVNFSNPTILNLEEDPPFTNILRLDESHGFIYMIIDGQFFFKSNKISPIQTAHPIHLHGSDFVILNQEFNTTYDAVESPKKFKLNNPARRDTAMLPSNGYLAIAFKPDNPGAWIMHCHIAWHASSGLALQLVVRAKDIPRWNNKWGAMTMVRRGCDRWIALTEKDPIVQTDSGI